MSNYNYLAPFYKILSRFVFGSSIERVNARLLEFVKEGSSLLILGGGNGEVLRSIDKESIGTVVFCDSSKKMLELAKTKTSNTSIRFIQNDALNLKEYSYDYVMLPFFLDQFSEAQCTEFLDKVYAKSQQDTSILFADMNGNGLPHWLVRFMYLFFRITTGLKQKNLPDFKKVFNDSRWNLAEENKQDLRFHCKLFCKA